MLKYYWYISLFLEALLLPKYEKDLEDILFTQVTPGQPFVFGALLLKDFIKVHNVLGKKRGIFGQWSDMHDSIYYKDLKKAMVNICRRDIESELNGSGK